MNNEEINNWRILLFNGLMALLYGVLAIFASEGLILTLVTYVGILIIIYSLAMFYGVFINYKNGLAYGVDFLQGLIMFGLGVLLTFYSKESVNIFVIVIGSWSLLLGITQLYYAFKLPFELHSKKIMLINGAFSMILGVILLFNPFRVASFMVILSGILALLIGIILIVVAVKMKNYRVEL
jgi:uncharacterized membrane protein HdeD (DUF308 family)